MNTATQGSLTQEELASVLYDATARYVREQEGKPKSEDGTPWIPATVWASQYSACARQLTLRMTKGHELPSHEPETLARFRRGKDRARNIRADLEQAGRDARIPFELVGAEERFVLQWNGDDVITGKVDWKTKFAVPGLKPIPTELKSWSPLLTDRIHTFEDLFSNRWTRKGAFQLLSYMWSSSSELGLFVLDRPGIPKFLPVSLFANEAINLLRVEKFLSVAHDAVLAKNSGTLPDYVKDPEECKTCDFLGSHCTPPMIGTNEGLKFISDENLAAILNRRAELQEAAKEFDKLDDSVKKSLRGVELGMCGDWLIEGKWQKNTKTIVPAEHQKLAESWKQTDPKGKFMLKFFRLNGQPDKEGQGDD